MVKFALESPKDTLVARLELISGDLVLTINGETIIYISDVTGSLCLRNALDPKDLPGIKLDDKGRIVVAGLTEEAK